MPRIRIGRWMRLALLVMLPVLLATFYHYAQWTTPGRSALGVSNGGSRVVYSEKRWMPSHLDPNGDLTKHHLVIQDGSDRTRQAVPAEYQFAALSFDQQRIAVGGSDGDIAVYDANSLELLRSNKVFSRALLVNSLIFSRNGKYLALTGLDSDRIERSQFCIVDVETLDVVLELGEGEVWRATSGAPGRLVHRRRLPKAMPPFAPGQIVEFEQGQLEPIAAATEHVQTDYSASLRFAVDTSKSPLFLLWDREENTSRTLTIPQSHYPLFSPAEDRLVVLSVTDLVSVVNLGSAQVIQTWKLRGERYMEAVFSPHGRWLAVGTAAGEIEVWDAVSGKRRYVIRVEPRGYWLWAMAVLGGSLWCLCWLALGWKDHRTWLVVRDVAIVSVIAGTGFFMRLIYSGYPADGSRPAAIGSITVLVGMSSLVVCWLAFGQGRWSLRISVSLGALAILWAGPLWAWQHYQLTDTAIPIGGAAITMALLLELLGLRFLGFVVLHDASASGGSSPRSSAIQMPLRDLMIIPAAVGILLLVSKLATIPNAIHGAWLASQLCVVTTQVAIIAVVGWIALSKHRAFVRYPLGLIGVGLFSVSASFVSSTISLGWYAILQCSIGLYVYLCLSMIRRCGWRLQKLDRSASG